MCETTRWTYEGFWNAVLGANRSAADVIREFELDPTDLRGLDEWVNGATAEAHLQLTGTHTNWPEEWADYVTRAVNELADTATYYQENTMSYSYKIILDNGGGCTIQALGNFDNHPIWAQWFGDMQSASEAAVALHMGLNLASMGPSDNDALELAPTKSECDCGMYRVRFDIDDLDNESSWINERQLAEHVKRLRDKIVP